MNINIPAFGGKKLAFIIPLIILLAAACQRQAVIKLSPKGIKPPTQATSTTGQKPTPAKKPNAAANPTTKQNPEGEQSYSNIQNNSTFQNSAQNDSTFIQNSSSSNNSSSININLNSSSFPAGTVGQPYSSSISFQQSGNQQIFVGFSGLPPGLGLAVDGSLTLTLSTTIVNPGKNPSLTLAGTPTQAGEYNVTIKLDNKAGTVISQQFTLTINP
jgi:hypothetical protein